MYGFNNSQNSSAEVSQCMVSMRNKKNYDDNL